MFIIGHLGGGSGRKVFPITRANGQVIKQIGNIDQDKRERVNPQTGRVYATDGRSPCLSTMQGGGLEPKILCINTKNADGKQPPQHDRIYQTDGILPALCAELGGRNNILEVRPCLTPGRAEKRQNGRRFKNPGEEMFTLTAQDIHGVLISQKTGVRECEVGCTLDANYFKGLGSNQERTVVMVRQTEDGFHLARNDEKKSSIQGTHVTYPEGRSHCLGTSHVPMTLEKPPHIPGPEDVNNTVRSSGRGSITAKHNHDTIHDGVRIRKLTPRECFRLQGFPDWAFDRAKAAGISDSQLYKQAGNSVTVNVINAIAKRLGAQP